MNIKSFTTVLLFAGLAAPEIGTRLPTREVRADEQVVRISASNFQFRPGLIRVKKDVPVTFEFTSEDRQHRFRLTAFNVRTEVKPGAVAKVRFVPDKAGRFAFICDMFCGDGHEDMFGTLVVEE